MIIHPSNSYVSVLLNIIIQSYHYDATSVCILWNQNFHYNMQQTNLGNYAAVTSLHRVTQVEDEDIPSDRLDLLTKFEEILMDSILHSHCESFIAFEEEIMLFVSSFMKSVLHSRWRSLNNKFLFVYTQDRFNDMSEFNQAFFKDFSNILTVEIVNETVFELKTNKFVGSRKKHPEQLIFLDRYSGDTNTFELNVNLYPDKTKNLQGRELISAVVGYEPFAILREKTMKNSVMDVKGGNEDISKSILYDGTDAQPLIQLCWVYNCTLQVDTTFVEEDYWGFVYENYTADGVLGLVYERKADIAMMAMYMWLENYRNFDMSMILVRSGVTCLVPAPRRVISWLLPIEPFHWILWIAIVGCLILETIGLLVTRHADRTKDVSWKDCARFGYVTSLKLFVSQGSRYLPSSLSVRIVLFSCYMIDIIITSIYSGGLASILTVPTLEEVADSLERLDKYNLVWSGAVYNWILAINGSDEPIMQRILKNFRLLSGEEIIKNHEYAKTVGTVIESLTYGHFAIPDYIDQDLIDNLKLMVDDIYYQYCVAFVPRGWSLMEKFNNILMMMHSSGLSQFLEWRVVADHMNEKIQKQVGSSAKLKLDGGPEKLGMKNFAGIGVILVAGIILSILVFVGELVHYRLAGKKLSHKQQN